HGPGNGDELPEELAFKQKRLATIKAAKAALEAREEALHPGKPITDKKQISFADEEARIMGKKGDFDYRYNGQISVDSDQHIIVGQHLSQNANDKQEVKPALVALKDAAGQLPDEMSLDNGYYSGDNLEALEQAEVDAYVAVDRGEQHEADALEHSERRLVKADFVYDEASDSFRCPADQMLPLKTQNKAGQRLYQGEASICQSCPYYPRCCRSKKGEARTITSDGQEAVRQQMRDKMGTAAAKGIYKQRKVIVEPVFGHIKNGGFRNISLRGKEKAAGEFSLVCAAHNLKKMVKAAVTGLVRPEPGHWVAQTG
ncbi:MAG: transposase, partial [Endozoicomonas sp.]